MAGAIIAVLLGIVGRTVIPYLEELRQNPDTTFDKKFLVPAVVSVVIALITAPLVLAAIPPDQLEVTTLSGFAVLFVAAWGLTDVARAGQKLFTSSKAAAK